MASLSASGKPLDASHPLDFGSPGVRQSSTRTLTVTNSGQGLLTITPLSPTPFAGNYPADYSIASNACTGQIAPSHDCTITIKFTPGGSGERDANLNFSDNTGAFLIVILQGKA